MSRTTEEGAVARKRKLKFSERELEYLIEEVAKSNDKLFGKLSIKVPEAEKLRILNRIQNKVNAVGVTHRSIEDLKKRRCYDLRSHAKKWIAQRLKEVKGTGGGTSTVPDNTAIEDLVEGTIQPEAVVGVTQLDTSGAASSTQDAAEVETDDSECGDSTQATVEAAVSTPVTPSTIPQAPPRRRATVTPLQPMETDQDHETAPETKCEPHNYTSSTCPDESKTQVKGPHRGTGGKNSQCVGWRGVPDDEGAAPASETYGSH
ncbi:uncharacterized protein LOC144752546 [Lissotriton helveticus]